MTFLHGSLIAVGSLLIAVPIILHLTMRQRPKFAVFPALRFVQATLAQNQRRLQLRHWALLALRCLAIAAAAVALARPLLPPGAAGSSWLLSGSLLVWLLLVAVAGLVWMRGPSRWLTVSFVAILALASLGLLAIAVTAVAGGDSRWLPQDQEAPTAAVFLIDNAPRLMYRRDNRSRLATAQDAAVELLRQLPPGSEIAVMTTGDRNAAFTTDSISAAAAIRGLEIAFVTSTLTESIPRAQAMLRERAQTRRELYIFTDLTEAAWQPGWRQSSPGSAPSDADDSASSNVPTGGDTEDQEIATYVIDVGIKAPRNVRIGPPRVPDQWSTVAGALSLEVVVDACGSSADQELELELWLEEPATERPVIVDGQPSLPPAALRDRVRVTVPAQGSVTQRFQLDNLEEGLRHGHVEVRRTDPLPIDNVRSFTIASAPPVQLLVAAGPDTFPQWVTDVLAPLELRATGRARYECELIAAADLRDYALDRFAAVLLVDPPPLDESIWRELEQFVVGGGGLICLLGRNASPVTAFHGDAARRLLPGKLSRQWKAGARPQALAPRVTDHPLLGVFRTRETAIPWDQSPVYRHWVFDDLMEAANTVIRYRNRQPALLEVMQGRGIALTLTTPLSDPLNVPSRPPWNLLPTSSVPWPFLILLDQMVQHVVQQDISKVNYLAGEMGEAPAQQAIDGSHVDVLTPAGVWETATVQDGRVPLGMLQRPGSYRLAFVDQPTVLGGVSVNIAREATTLTRVERRKLDEFLGQGRYRYFDNLDRLTREVSDSRVGQEGFPWVILAMALILAAEHLFSNRFYSSSPAPKVA